MDNEWPDSEIKVIININTSVICFRCVFLKILYRLLRPDENPKKGLKAKDPFSTVSVKSHVSFGSRGPDSRYISCSRSKKSIKLFASHSTTNPKRIVKLKIDENDRKIKRIIDLTDEDELEKHELSEQGMNFARKFQEVLIEGEVSAECIESCTTYTS